MGIKVGINGFGRIGRNIMRAAMGTGQLDFVAVNDLTDTAMLAHLLKYDSILGNLEGDVQSGSDWISVDGDKFQVLAETDPAALPWGKLGVDPPKFVVVSDATIVAPLIFAYVLGW